MLLDTGLDVVLAVLLSAMVEARVAKKQIQTKFELQY